MPGIAARAPSKPFATSRLNRKNEKRTFRSKSRWMVKYSQAIDIDFLGVWDTVGARVLIQIKDIFFANRQA
jgi:hypothetical protein